MCADDRMEWCATVRESQILWQMGRKAVEVSRHREISLTCWEFTRQFIRDVATIIEAGYVELERHDRILGASDAADGKDDVATENPSNGLQNERAHASCSARRAKAIADLFE
jgi:hypothetical protein